MRYLNSLPLTLALAAIPTSFAQTFSDCDPTKKADCPTKPGLTSEYSVDFRSGAAALDQWTTTTGVVNPTAEGGEFKIAQLGDGPTLRSKFQIFFGYVEVVMKAAPGAGIVSSFVMESDDLDEIDWEWIGSDAAQAQSNYFGKGNTSSYDRGKFHPIAAPETTFHTYAVNWTKESTTWLVDGTPVRTLNFADALGGQNYPQTPMDVRLGNWVAGDPKNAPGTIQWAGGLTDFSKGPFSMVVQSVKVINYNPGTSYRYGDMSGSWQSIQVEGSSATAPTVVATKSNSTTGPGEVVNAPPVVSINPGAANGNGSGIVPSGTSCTKSRHGHATALPATVSINPVSGGKNHPSPGTALSNSTSSGSSGANGIVNQGSPSNATLPVFTISPGGGSSNSPTSISSSLNPAQTSFALGAQSGLATTTSSRASPAQVTTSKGSKEKVGGLVAGLLAVGVVFVCQ